MKKNLIEEIQTIKKNMGLITESMRTIGMDLVRNLYRYLKKKKYGFNQKDMDDLEKYTRGEVGPDEIENIIGKMIRQDPKVSKLIGGMIYDEWKKNNPKMLKSFGKTISNASKNGIGYGQTLSQLRQRVDNSNIVLGYQNPDIINYVKNRLKTDLDKLVYLTYTPYEKRFVKGFEGGLGDQNVSVYSGFKYALNRGYQGLKKTLSFLTSGKVKPWDDEFRKRYKDPAEIKAINEWFIAGLPDTPAVRDSYKRMGLINASGRAVRQLWKKYVALTYWLWAFEYINESVKVWTGDKKLTEWEKERIDNDGKLGELAVQLNRMWRTLDFAPALKYTSPAVLAGWGLVDAWLASGRGDKEVQKNRFLQFLDPSKKDKATLKPSEFVDDFIWLSQHLPEVNKNIAEDLAQTRRELQAMGELARNNQKVDSTDKVVTADTKKTPDTTQTVKTPVSTDTMALYKQFLKEKYPKRTFDNPVSLGNNRFKPYSASNVIQQFDGKTFNTIKN